MAVRIKFDNTHNVITPTFVLATRKGKKIGAIPATNISLSDAFNAQFDLSFQVQKYDNGNECVHWDKITNFRLLWCPEWDIWFEIYVEIASEDGTVKNITCVSLGESELSQINLYNIEINTENDIAREDYNKDYPTVLYREDHIEASLLHRIMEKAPHYTIGHVDVSIANIQRTFTFDSQSLLDAFHTIADEIDCIFVIDSSSNDDGSIKREINVYDLQAYCLECGTRDNFTHVCPECNSKNILTGYGKDTSIFVSTDNLADNITFTTDTSSVKNCFRLVAGDDLMTATVLNCNPNGSGYIWNMSDETRADMSAELSQKLGEYDTSYLYYIKEHKVSIPEELLTSYNALIEKYAVYNDKLRTISSPIVGYQELMNALYDTIDLYLFLNDSFMPSPELSRTTAALQAARLGSNTLSPVAVEDLSRCSSASASNAVLSVARTIVDPRYRVKVKNGVLDGDVWVGNFTVTNYADETDTADSLPAQVIINDDKEEYIRQKLEKTLKDKADDNDANDIVSLFELSLSVFVEEIKKYCLTSLQMFEDSCQSCLDILIEQGIANSDTWADKTPNLYSALYTPYYQKLLALQDEMKVRESEIATIIGVYDLDDDLTQHGLQTFLEEERANIQNSLNLEGYLGTELWLEFVSYRREDTYTNDNYISDGLDNGELFNRAMEFIEVANKEIYKSSTLQHSISATLKNLLVMKEFTPLVEHFAVGNWIRVEVDNTVYRLRLVSYTIDFENLENISIEFSDVKRCVTGVSDTESVLNQAASMAGTYDAVTRQASQGQKSNKQLEDWTTKGLALTKMKIIDNADHQNVTWDSHGILCREYLPTTNMYSDKQLKIINRGLYLTDDNWLTSKAGIGDFTYYNPETGKFEEAYGVIADTLIGNLILGEKVGIYNTKNSITMDERGLVITTDYTDNVEDGTNEMAFTIQRRSIDEDGEEQITRVLYIDGYGDLVLNGAIRINSSADTSLETLNDLCNIDRFSASIQNAVHTESQNIYSDIDRRYQEVLAETNAILEQYKADTEQYMRFDGNGLTLGAIGSEFHTLIDNRGVYFKQGDTIVSYVNNNQLYIPNGVIENSLVLGKFFFSPREDGGVSLTWEGDTEE
ncbi:MAG: hypothetical protein IJ439_05370 [Tyzzerella sp.]|nr:hypothetical protein [Tyzzerella sp.]